MSRYQAYVHEYQRQRRLGRGYVVSIVRAAIWALEPLPF